MKQRDQRKRRKPKPYQRKIHFSNDEVWSWRCGSDYIRIRDPRQDKSHVVSFVDLTGWTWDDIERGHWKGYAPAVTPQIVKDYIEAHLRPAPGDVHPAARHVHPFFTKVHQWHVYWDCKFLPHKRKGMFEGKDPDMVSAEHLEERLGEKPTRLNVCPTCMRRLLKAGELAA